MSWSTSTSKEKTEITKNALDIFVRLSLALFIAACVIIPDFIKKASRYTGLNIVALASGKFEAYAEEIVSLQQQLRDTTAIATTQAEEISQFQRGQSSPTTTQSTINPTLKSIIERNDDALARSSALLRQAPLTASDGGQWGVVAGGDRDVASAKDEITKLREKGYTPRLFKRQDWFRTVALFKSREEAYAALQQIRTQNRTAYPVDLLKWCPDRKTGAEFDTCPADSATISGG